MQVCTSLQTDNHASTPPLSFLQAGCPSCRPTNSVKALKAHRIIYHTEPKTKKWKREKLKSKKQICSEVLKNSPISLMHFSVLHYASIVLAMALCLSVHLSQASIVSKQLDKSSWVLAWRLPFTYPTLCFREIWACPKIRVLPSGTVPNSGLENFATPSWSGQQNTSTLELVVDRTYSGRRHAWLFIAHRSTVILNSITSICFRFVVQLVPTVVQQLTRFDWHSVLHGTSAVTELLVISWLHPGITTQ